MRYFGLIMGWFACVCTGFAQVSWNYYYGNLHAHTAYSDGSVDCSETEECTPAEAYWYANSSTNFDFLGISEHNHAGAGMQRDFYRQGLIQADTSTIPGEFVGLYGMEWGVISNGGHVLIYGFDSLIGWESGNFEVYNGKYDYQSLFQKLNRHPGAIAYLAHPTASDYNNLLSSAWNPVADEAIVGMAARSGPAFSTDTTYSNPSGSNYMGRFRDGLRIGYKMGVGIDHDNHYVTFGRTTQARTVIMARGLTQADLLDGLRTMRFYASDDWNARIEFTISGAVMGQSIALAGQPNISVRITDLDGEIPSYIRVYSGLPGGASNGTILVSRSNTDTLTFSGTQLGPNETNYFYVEARQTDGNMLWSSPIWYTRNDAKLVATPVIDFYTTSSRKICIGDSVQFREQVTFTSDQLQWQFAGGQPALSSALNPTVVYAQPGLYDVQLWAQNAVGADSVMRTGYVEVNPLPPVPTVIQTGNLLTSSAAAGYQWYVNDSLLPGANSQQLTISDTGNYSVRITDQNGCKRFSNEVIEQPTGLPTATQENWLVYPNPITGSAIHISSSSPLNAHTWEVQLYTAYGQLVSSWTIASGGVVNTLALPNLASGVYMLHLTSSGSHFVQRLVKP